LAPLGGSLGNPTFRTYNAGVRLVEFEPRPAAWQIAFDAALLEARAGRLSPDSLRFPRYEPPALLLGAHQRWTDPVPDGVDLQRRLTGGGEILVDSDQFAWSWVGPLEGDLRGRIRSSMRLALHRLGYPAEDDLSGLTLKGRTVCAIGETSEKGSSLLQSFLFIASPPCAPLKTISLFEAGGGAAPSIEEIRRIFLDLLVSDLGLSIESGRSTNEERALLAEKLPHVRSLDWIRSVSDPEGEVFEGADGLLRAAVRSAHDRKRIDQVRFSGTFCALPRTTIRDLEEELGGVKIEETPARIEDFFLRTGAEIPGLSAGDFFTALSLAFMKQRISLSAAPDPESWKKELGA